MLEIPFNPSISADQKFQVLIPEQMVITLRLLWNGRASAWFVTVSSDSGELGQFRLVERFPILHEHKALSPIKGDIIVLPLSDGQGKPLSEYSALGDSWGMFWISPEELAEWEAANALG